MNKFKLLLVCLSILNTSPGFTQDDGGLIVVTSDQLEQYWISAKKVAPIYPNTALQRSVQGCAAVSYVIEADGSTSSHNPIASSPSGIFNKSAIKAASQFRYEPSEENTERTAVFTTNTFTYEITSGRKIKNLDENHEAIAVPCSTAANEALKSLGS